MSTDAWWKMKPVSQIMKMRDILKHMKMTISLSTISMENLVPRNQKKIPNFIHLSNNNSHRPFLSK